MRDKGKHSAIAGRSTNLWIHYGNQCGGFSRSESLYLKYVPLLDIYPTDSTSYYRDTSSTMFIAGLFIIIRNWKQTTVHQWMNVWRKCEFSQWIITKLLKNEPMKFSVKWMEIEKKITLSNSDQKRQIWCVSTYMWTLALTSLISRL